MHRTSASRRTFSGVGEVHHLVLDAGERGAAGQGRVVEQRSEVAEIVLGRAHPAGVVVQQVERVPGPRPPTEYVYCFSRLKTLMRMVNANRRSSIWKGMIRL